MVIKMQKKTTILGIDFLFATGWMYNIITSRIVSVSWIVKLVLAKWSFKHRGYMLQTVMFLNLHQFIVCSKIHLPAKETNVIIIQLIELYTISE